jgi:hypothetical protein
MKGISTAGATRSSSTTRFYRHDQECRNGPRRVA